MFSTVIQGNRPCSWNTIAFCDRRAPRRIVDAAAVGLIEAGDDAQHRGLAAAARPDDAHELAVGDGQREIVERDHVRRRRCRTPC